MKTFNKLSMSFAIIVLLMATEITTAQYKRVAIGIETGLHSVGDESATVTDNYNHFGGSFRYNLNETVGIGLTGAYDNLTLQDFDGFITETNYSRINLDLNIDIFDILGLQNDFITLHVNGGPGIGFIDYRSEATDRIFNVSGGAKALFKVSKGLALYAGYTTAVNIGQKLTLDGAYPITNASINSTVDNLSIGLLVYFGKRGQEHADWWVKPENLHLKEFNDINTRLSTLENQKPVQAVNNTYVSNEIVKLNESIFFVNDKHTLTIAGLNALGKALQALIKDETGESKATIIGWASNTSTTSVEYDLELASDRADFIKHKLLSLGTDLGIDLSGRVTSEAKGKDMVHQAKENHDYARRVEIVIE